jgi:competence protein ComEC
MSGCAMAVLFFSLGALIARQKDIRNNNSWLGNSYSSNDAMVVSLDEPLVEKTKSFKANASARFILRGNKLVPVKGKIILYIKKDSLRKLPVYGSKILFKKSLQAIKNSGNPGGFDYKRYCLFRDITHQVYLQEGEFDILPGKDENWLQKFIWSSREKILSALRKNISGEKELGLAEALLIGYKDDLDQTLVQSYTNTGVVHIIAISGLHLGLIYWLLMRLLIPLKRIKRLRWLSPLLVISGLWLFSLLAGVQSSVLRSALMFTCIVLGESLGRKTSIFNSMALSAFISLCINPYTLWDVGFQLSYAAVCGIIIFMKPVYNWFYIKNKLLDFIWKLNAVTIAAQVLTVPLSIYHFHQFPSWFMLTNFVAVPLSSIILLTEIFLCTISFIPPAAIVAGKIVACLIWLMNTYIERVELLPFSLLDGLQISGFQAILLLLFAAGISLWLLEKSKAGLKIGLITLLSFIACHSWSYINANGQQKIIVYNVPRKKAIDLINGRKFFFIGDSDLLSNNFARNFHLKPARVINRTVKTEHLDGLIFYKNYISYYDKHILLLDKTMSFDSLPNRLVIDLLIISKNPKIYIRSLARSLDIRQIVFDASVPARKLAYWKKDCDSLHIPWHDVTKNGAFVMNF